VRTKRLYRVVVDEDAVASAVGFRWEPDTGAHVPIDRPYRAGQVVRHYQTERAAFFGWSFLKQHGVAARIERSDPITWTEATA
jgi:hypothetical protein